jgi:hypothetical protein
MSSRSAAGNRPTIEEEGHEHEPGDEHDADDRPDLDYVAHIPLCASTFRISVLTNFRVAHAAAAIATISITGATHNIALIVAAPRMR